MLQKSTEKSTSEHEALETEIERNNFTRAAHLARSLKLTENELKRIQRRALVQMAVAYRNPHGTKALAQQFGYSKQEVKQILTERVKQNKINENIKHFKTCYDYATGKHLTFEEWINHYIEKWHKL